MFEKIHSLAGPESMARLKRECEIYNCQIFIEEHPDIYIEMGLQ